MMLLWDFQMGISDYICVAKIETTPTIISNSAHISVHVVALLAVMVVSVAGWRSLADLLDFYWFLAELSSRQDVPKDDCTVGYNS